MSAVATTAPAPAMVSVLCCMCGIVMPQANASNTCASCLASASDITRGISNEATLHQCRGCRRWHKEAGKWIACELESRDLMALCLANVSGLKPNEKKDTAERVRLIDASWIWTEPHSMRLKIRLTIQKEVQTGTILQQSFVVTFVVRNQQCIECQAEFRQGSWKSLVQVRQRVKHKRTFLYLEQLILKHDAHRGCLSIETFRDGMDFYFPDKGKAARFISFLENVVPTKIKTSKKLIGTDDKSNISNYKYTNLVEICPLCKDDLLYLPAKTARSLGDISRLVLVKNISNAIHLIDPLSGQTALLSGDAFWRDPIRPLITAARSRMTRFVVLGKDPVVLPQRKHYNVSKRAATPKQRRKLALLTLAREADLGNNDTQLMERSHVGYLCKSGDVCVGYDLVQTQMLDDDIDEELRSRFPDVIVLRKLYGGAAEQDINAKRIWKLRRLDVQIAEKAQKARGSKKKDIGNDDEDDAMDEEDFMQEVEADREMRSQMNLYKHEIVAAKQRADADAMQDDGDDDDEDDQEIQIDELLDNLVLEAGPDDEQEPEAERMGDDGYFVSMQEGEKAVKDGIGYVGRDAARQLQEKEAAIAKTSFDDDYMAKQFKDL